MHAPTDSTLTEEPINGTIWINKKSGKEYLVMGVSIDCTNSRDGERNIVYVSVTDWSLYNRCESEFYSKFEKK